MKARGGEAAKASARRRAQGGLRLSVGQRGEGRQEREILRAVRRQGHAHPLLMDVRAELGQAVPVLHVADGWVRPRLVLGQRGTRRSRRSPRRRRKRSMPGRTKRGWSQIPLFSGYESPFQADYKCQDPKNDDMQQPVMHVFTKRDGKIFHFWATETTRTTSIRCGRTGTCSTSRRRAGRIMTRRRRNSGRGFWRSIIWRGSRRWCASPWTPNVVIAGLDPAIHSVALQDCTATPKLP